MKSRETVPESGNVSDWENSMENMEETDEEYLEEIRNQSGAEQQKNLSETGGTNRDGTEDLQDMPSDRERLPVTIVSPTAAADIVSGPGQIYIRQRKQKKMTEIRNRKVSGISCMRYRKFFTGKAQ